MFDQRPEGGRQRGMNGQQAFDIFAKRPRPLLINPEPNIGFARSGDKVGTLTNRQCRKCGGRTHIHDGGFFCHHCGPQSGER